MHLSVNTEEPSERKRCSHQYECPSIKVGDGRCPYIHDLPFPSWSGLYCGTGISIIVLDSERVPYLLVQREIERSEDGVITVLKWGSPGGSVLESPIEFSLTRDVSFVRSQVTEMTFREAAVREVFEETRGVLFLDPSTLIEADHFEQGNRKKYPNEYLIARSYVVILGSNFYRQIQDAIDSGIISGCTEEKGSTIDTHLLIPLEQVLSDKIPDLIPLTDTAKWNSYKKWLNVNVRSHFETILAFSKELRLVGDIS